MVHPMHHARGGHQASLLEGGTVLITGGCSRFCDIIINTAELYNSSTENWIVAESMHVKRVVHTASVLRNGNVLVTGGIYTADDDHTNTIELYNSSKSMVKIMQN